MAGFTEVPPVVRATRSEMISSPEGAGNTGGGGNDARGLKEATVNLSLPGSSCARAAGIIIFRITEITATLKAFMD